MSLALFGGPKVRTNPWPTYPMYDDRDKEAACRVIESGLLNGFRASHGPWFLGGPEVRALEDKLADYHGVRNVIAVSSATAGLHVAVAATCEPGDEVIVSPYSFDSSATCALMHNCIPVFADISRDTFGIDPSSVADRITDRTRAIVVVHLFGGPAQMDELLALADEHGLYVIEDCAQSPGARYKGRLVGTIGDFGILSFVGQKNASCGEGGAMLTDDDRLAGKAGLLRNHAEALHEPMLGYNYRLQEIQAAIVSNQWDKLDESNRTRRRLVASLVLKMREEGIEGIHIPPVPRGSQHSFYVCPFLYDAGRTGIPRGLFVDAMNAEGIPMGAGYIQPLYLLPLFQRRAHFAFEHFGRDVSYHKGLCPVCEEMSFERLMLTMVCRPPATEEDMADVAKAMRKVLDQCALY